MCFFKTPKPPKPPPVPTPPNPTEASMKAEEDAKRRAAGAQTSRQSTVLTSPLGDAGTFGQNVYEAGAVKGTTIG